VPALGGKGIGGEPAHPHHEVIRPSMTGDAPLGGLDSPVELLQSIVGAGQAGDVVAMVQMVAEVFENRAEVLDRWM